MKKENFIYYIFAISFLANCVFIYTNLSINKTIKKRENTFIELVNNKEQKEMNIANNPINPFEYLLNIEGDTILLKDLFEGSNKLLLLLSNNNCGVCNEESLIALANSSKDKSIENIIILGYYQNKRSFFLLGRKFPFKFYLLNENSSLREVALKGPVFFCLDDSFLVYSPFFPLQQYGLLTQHYLNKAFEKYNIGE